jgi:hypothetical protein
MPGTPREPPIALETVPTLASTLNTHHASPASTTYRRLDAYARPLAPWRPHLDSLLALKMLVVLGSKETPGCTKQGKFWRGGGGQLKTPQDYFVGKHYATQERWHAIGKPKHSRWVYERSGWKSHRYAKERSKLGITPRKPFVLEFSVGVSEA